MTKSIEVVPLWSILEFQRWIGLKRSAADDFLKKNPDLPRVKIGGAWRFDPEELKSWFRRKQHTHIPKNDEA